MKLVATRILPILTGIAFLNFATRLILTVLSDDPAQGYGVFGAILLFFAMIVLTIIVGTRWQKRNGKLAGRGTTAGSAATTGFVAGDPTFGNSGGPSDFGGGGGGDGGGGGA